MFLKKKQNQNPKGKYKIYKEFMFTGPAGCFLPRAPEAQSESRLSLSMQGQFLSLQNSYNNYCLHSSVRN